MTTNKTTKNTKRKAKAGEGMLDRYIKEMLEAQKAQLRAKRAMRP